MVDKCISLNLSLIENGKGKIQESNTSFLASKFGIYCLEFLNTSDKKRRDHMIELVLREGEKCFDKKYCEYELLNGNTGFIYCLLLISKEIGENSRIFDLLQKVIHSIIKQGQTYTSDPNLFLVKWPQKRNEDKYYMGAVHGLIGALQMILQSIKVFP